MKSPDFLVVGPTDSRLVVDVKGRRFGGSADKPRRVWQNWCERDDVGSLERWTAHLGPGFRGVLAFVYHIAPELGLAAGTPDAFVYRDELYLVRGVEVADYRAAMRTRSPRWSTVHLPTAAFRRGRQAVLVVPRIAVPPGAMRDEPAPHRHRRRIHRTADPRRRSRRPRRWRPTASSSMPSAVSRPTALGETGRRELRNLLRSFNQDLAALGVPLRRGLDAAENLQPRLEHIRKVMQLALRSRRAPRRRTVPGHSRGSPTRRVHLTMRESLLALGAFGDRIGTVLALEIGLDPAEKVKEYLDRFDTGSLNVTYDPANMIMHGHDPLASLMPLEELIWRTSTPATRAR